MVNKLRLGIKKALGRNRGKISSYHREQGKKKLYKFIDFSRNLYDVLGKIKVIQYDGFRTSKIVGVTFTNGFFTYMLAIEGMQLGDYVFNTQKKKFKYAIGLTCKLQYVKIGDKIHNLEFYPGDGGKVTRSAGSFSKIIKKYLNSILIKLQSGEFRLFSPNCLCTIGRVSNINHNQIIIGKAGVNRLLGWRPTVRGRAMNPVDHPHGGRTNGGITPVTPWGKITRGIRTVKRYKAEIIKKSRK